MKRSIVLLFSILTLSLFLSSCRPPDLEGAIVHFKANRMENALELAQKATKEHPENAEAWFWLGKIDGKLGHISDMVKAFDKCLALGDQYKTDIANEKNYYFATSYNEGIKNYQNFSKLKDKDINKANDSVKKAIKNFTDANSIKKSFMSVRLISACYQLLNDNAKAIEASKKLTEAFPDSAISWAEYGQMLFINKQYKEAIPVLSKSLELDNSNGTAATLLAQAYDNQKDMKNAIKYYKLAIENNPEEKALPFNLALLSFNRANNENTSKEDKKAYLEDAALYFGKVIEIDPNMKEAYQLKGQSELLLKKYETAKETLMEGLEFFPDDDNMWYNLGVCYARLGNKKKSRQAFDKAEALQNK